MHPDQRPRRGLCSPLSCSCWRVESNRLPLLSYLRPEVSIYGVQPLCESMSAMDGTPTLDDIVEHAAENSEAEDADDVRDFLFDIED